MATGKQGFVRATEPQHLVSVQREKELNVQAPLPAMYIQAVSGLPSYPQAQPAAVQDAAVIPLSVPMMYANQTLPFLTLHIASGAGLQQQRPEPPASSSRPKSAGKHVCPHCGRDCLKPSVLEKHLRCHTGERPYPCTTCGISFKTQSNLYKHKRTQAHARLFSESGKGTFSSQESTESSRENCSSPSLELQNEDSGDTNRNDGVRLTAATSTGSSEEVKTGSETEWALCKAAVVGVIASPAHGQQVISHTVTQRVPQLSSDAAPIQAKSPNGDGRAPLTPNRTPLQRQEALFPKSQSHDSTDSGFSESNEQHSTSSPGTTLHDPSMELEEPETSEKLSDVGTDDIKSKVSLQEKQKLEKHILKLISENSVVMDDKHLVNVRPRKTVLSKQGSIDLPMPYTYKDSFHFEIRSSKHQVSSSQKQDRKGRAFYSSMPTQHSISLEHAPLTRSSSLPFSVGIQNSDITLSPYEVDNVPLSRRCSAGHIYPIKSLDQHTPSHRSLVRQVAVDGLSAVERSPMERGSLSSLSSDGDCTDTASESVVKRCRRKKAQKFAYNKWYMYGGGTFKKLYNIEKDSVLKSRKSTLSPEQTESQGIQISQQKDSNTSASVSVSYTSCSAPSLSPVANVLTAQTSSQVLSSYLLVQNTPMKQSAGQPQQSLTKQTNVPSSDLNTVMNAIKGTEEKGRAPETQLSTPIPSERKKQRTDEHLSAFVENTEALIKMQRCASRQVNTNLCQSLQSDSGDVPQKSSLTSLQRDNGLSLNRQGSFTNLSSSSNQRQILFKRHSSPLFVANMSGTSASPSASSSISSVSQAKTSFLPVYQLKIPGSTDGMSDPCLGKGSSLNPSSPKQNVSLNQQPATTSPSTPQNQSTVTVMSPGHEQGTLCITAITKATSMTPAVYSCQNANAYTSTYSSTASVSLASPLAFTDTSVNVSTTHSSISPVCHSSTSTKNSQVYAGNVASVQDNPAASVVIPTQSPGVTPAPVLPSSKDGIPLEISSTEIQGSQDTFYVQTADLQIVMQLISDEQLALIEPQIETSDYKTTGSHCLLSKDPETSGTHTIQTVLVLPVTPISASNQDEPIQPKSCQPLGDFSATATTINSRSVLACRVCPQQPLNQTGACSGDRLKYEENQTSASDQSGQHLARQDWSKTEEVKAITSRTANMTSAQFESHGPVSTCLKEENIKCALGPGGMHHINQDSFTEPPMSCSLQSLNIQWEAGTGRQKWIPLEPKSRGGDGTEWVGTRDMKSTWTKQEEDAVENKREEAKCTESYHTTVKPHPDLSTSQHMTNVSAASPELVSISTTSAICGITNPSPESKCHTNKHHVRENSPSANVAPKQIDQSNTKVKEHASLGHCESFTSLSRGQGDMRHLLAHPLLVNAIQKEVQKETQTKNSARGLTHSTSLQVQRPLPERETDGTARISMLNEPCMISPCNTEHCQIIKTTPAYTRPSCSNQTNSSCIHPNPTCTSSIHGNPTEPNAPHSYMEEEERSSSSDDEGKLVIELE
ncbi:hypothetical protein PDJAM_G00120590 [Pangasius djambal]|uniref:Uncharacterized protein n=1 Tax=Pangasius djambal TaxID=1691987 RepID=A0ACC5Z925_9TELE|nr:hypothetical protein [Pangasius djambal]